MYSVASETRGRIVQSHVAVGQTVERDQILVQLDAESQRLELAESSARLTGLGSAIAAILDEIAAQEQAMRNDHDARNAAVEEQLAVIRRAETAARVAQDDARRVERLFSDGLVSARDHARAQSDVERDRSTVEADRAKLKALEADLQVSETDRHAAVNKLRRELQLLEKDSATERATIHRLENEIARRLIRAPVSGRVAEAADIQSGGVLNAGDQIASIMVEHPLRVVAQFDPADALGRVRPRQHAEVRLHGFPVSEYGSISASVTTVAQETREGLVRIELALESSTPIALQHGMPADVLVEVERVSPARLLLRTLGSVIDRPVARSAARRAE
jgi:membrane fusion protein (multidrug efflux system)